MIKNSKLSGETFFTFLLGAMLLLNGCLVGGRSEVEREGTNVTPSTLDQIQPGKTAIGWIRAVLGEPTEQVTLSPGEELWKYAYTETRDSSGYVFFVFHTSDKKVTSNKVFVQFKDGIVTRSWRG
ncbi:MAG: outer membrane protein assembly factor BamE [Burkholderiales bacterium]|nr:outer membrane protein assembly factor BamE [Phycisphaerae bacterium]